MISIRFSINELTQLESAHILSEIDSKADRRNEYFHLQLVCY